jgi:hypothetical protein
MVKYYKKIIIKINSDFGLSRKAEDSDVLTEYVATR